jgi:hypothetical protein
VHLLDYAFYNMYWKQSEMLLLVLALKLGLHPVAIAHLSPGTTSLLLSKMTTGASQMEEVSTGML